MKRRGNLIGACFTFDFDPFNAGIQQFYSFAEIGPQMHYLCLYDVHCPPPEPRPIMTFDRLLLGDVHL